MLKAEENTREKTKCERVKEHTAKEIKLCRRLEIVIGTLVLIVAAIVMKAVYRRAAEISHQDRDVGGYPRGMAMPQLIQSTGVPGECAAGAVFHDSVIPMAYSGGMEDEIQIPPFLILPSVNLYLGYATFCLGAELIGEEKPGPTSGLLIPCSVIPVNEGNCWALRTVGIGSTLLPTFSSNLLLGSGGQVGYYDHDVDPVLVGSATIHRSVDSGSCGGAWLP